MSFDFHLSHWGCVPGLVGNMPAETTVRRSSRDMARSCWRPARSMQHHAAWKTRKILRHLKSVKEMEQRHPILSWIYNNKSKKYVGQCGPWDSLVWGILKIIIPSWIPREKPSPPHVFELRFFVWAVWQHEGLNPCHGLHETELSSSTVFHWHWMAYNPKGMFELQRPSSSYRHLWYFLIHLSNNISVLMFIWVHHFGCSGTVPLSSNIGQLVVDLACYGWFDIPCSVSRPCRHNQLQKQSIQSAPLPRKPVAVSQGWNNKCSITKPHKRNRSRVLNHTKPY